MLDVYYVVPIARHGSFFFNYPLLLYSQCESFSLLVRAPHCDPQAHQPQTDESTSKTSAQFPHGHAVLARSHSIVFPSSFICPFDQLLKFSWNLTFFMSYGRKILPGWRPKATLLDFQPPRVLLRASWRNTRGTYRVSVCIVSRKIESPTYRVQRRSRR